MPLNRINIIPSAYTQMKPVIAHRGASGHAPENTAAAIREAARLNAEWVEVDVTNKSQAIKSTKKKNTKTVKILSKQRTTDPQSKRR